MRNGSVVEAGVTVGRSARAAGAVALFVAALALASGPAQAQGNAPGATQGADAVSGATIQWAQTILDEKGLYQGRASGRMDSATAAAITTFQRRNGLKATGRLDSPTIEKLMEGRAPPPTMGNLADPTSRARPSSPVLRESEVKPQAAPAAPGVQREGGTEQSLFGGSVSAPAGPAASAPAPAAAVDRAATVGRATETGPPADSPPGPSSAPRAAVTVEGGPASEGGGWRDLVPIRWVQMGLLAIVGALVLGMLLAWWTSGRRPKRPVPKGAGASGPVRREPSLSAAGGPVLRAEPVIRAPSPPPPLARRPGR